MKTQEKKSKQKIEQKIEESLSYTVEVRDKEGRVIQRISAPSRSYVQQWNQILNAVVAHADKTIKDTSGADKIIKVSTFGNSLSAAAPIGNVNLGLRIGKGTTAVVITDYALESPLDEGTGTDEFNHQAVTFTSPSVVGPTCSFTVKRVIINNSGATISGIKEIGCYVFVRGTIATFYALAFRDVLPSAVYVPHGGSITVTYTIKVTV